MILDHQDGECLKLLGLCRYIPVNLSKKYSNEAIYKGRIECLRKYGLVKLASDEQCYKLTSIGRKALQEMGYVFKEDSRWVMGDKRYIRRQICADINVMLHSAGIPIFAETADELNRTDIGFLPLLNARSSSFGESLSCAQMAGLLRIRDTAYAIYYMSDEGVHISFEENIISQLISRVKEVKYTKIIFAGKSLEELWKVTFVTDVPKKQGDYRIPFRQAFEKFTQNILFLPCSRYGVTQTRIISASSYRKNLADYFCGGKTNLPISLSYCDGFYRGEPLVIAVDMDIKRLRSALAQAEKYGSDKPAVICLDFQEKMLRKFLGYRGVAKADIFALPFSDVAKELPDIPQLKYTNEPVRGWKGGCITI